MPRLTFLERIKLRKYLPNCWQRFYVAHLVRVILIIQIGTIFELTNHHRRERKFWISCKKKLVTSPGVWDTKLPGAYNNTLNSPYSGKVQLVWCDEHILITNNFWAHILQQLFSQHVPNSWFLGTTENFT
jgi:hypothetical protein